MPETGTLLDRIANGRTDLVFDYVEQGHPATSKDRDGVSLLQWCTYYGDVSAMRFLLSRGESLGDILDLNGPAFHGHWQLCEFLIEHGADVNRAVPESGETPLHSAMCRPAKAALVARVLLASGADANAATKAGVATDAFMRDCRTKGETPLHRAAAFADEDTIQLLLNAGARKDAKDMSGDTPLSWASWYRRPDTILRMLCYNDFYIRPGRKSMEAYLEGEPHA